MSRVPGPRHDSREGLGLSFDSGSSFRPVAPLSREGRGPYPGAHHGQANDADGYLKCRRAAETNSSKLWRVHGNLYDLAEVRRVTHVLDHTN
jgi:hypothetical protein